MADRGVEGKVSMINRMATFIKATTEELEEANRKLSELAVTDGMTGVGNKSAYLERIHNMDRKIGRGDASFTVFMFDLNGLKETNDKYGHECGDMVIVDAAEVLKTVFGRENLYRIGGDEFIAILDDAQEDEAERRFREMDAAVASKNKTERPYKDPLSISKGAAAFHPGEDTEYQDVFRRADQTMYQEKAAYYKAHNRRKHRD